jgi:hypothetical protein
VWVVGPHGADPVQGTLSVTTDGVSFSASGTEGLRVSPGAIRGVRRLRASPALKLVYEDPTGLREVFFFFAKPPPLPEASRVPGLSMRGGQRTVGAMALRAQSKRARQEIQAWVAEIRSLRRG